MEQENKENVCSDDYRLIIATFLADILYSKDKPIRECKLQINAIKQLYQYLHYYESLGYMGTLIVSIAKKKGELILSTTNKAEMEKLLKPRCPRYNGAAFVEDKTIIPEEELIFWSQASLKAPLNDVAFKRYSKVFQQVFQKEYNKHIKPVID